MVTLEGIVILAVVIVLSLLFTLRRVLPWRVIFGYAAIIDVVFSGAMMSLFKGTVSGAGSAALAGLLLAVILTACKWWFGSTTYRVRWISWRKPVLVAVHRSGRGKDVRKMLYVYIEYHLAMFKWKLSQFRTA